MSLHLRRFWLSEVYAQKIGCDQVAAIEENVVTAFTEVGGGDNNRFTVSLNRAYKVSRHALENGRLEILFMTTSALCEIVTAGATREIR